MGCLDRLCSVFLHECKEGGLLRSLRTIEGPQDRTVKIDSREYLSFASNDYLGMAAHTAVVTAAREALESSGLGAGASRLVVGNFRVHELLEEAIARFKGRDAAIIYPTGYMANIGIIPALAGRGDVIFSDASNHSSLIDGIRLSGATRVVYRHADMADLEEKLRVNSGINRRFIITDSLFSMEGDVAPLKQIVRLAREYDAITMIDDAHATGTLGKSGRGGEEYFGITGQVDIVMGTFSKAFGALGGFVAGSAALREFQLNAARSQIYSTGLPPPVAAGALAAVEFLEKDPSPVKALQENVRRLRSMLLRLGFELTPDETPIVLAVVGPEETALRLGEHFLKKGMIVPPMRYPTVPKGRAALRITLSALHTEDDIERLSTVFGEALKMQMGT